MAVADSAMLMIGATGRQGGATARAVSRTGVATPRRPPDVAALRVTHPGLLTLDARLHDTGWTPEPREEAR